MPDMGLGPAHAIDFYRDVNRALRESNEEGMTKWAVCIWKLSTLRDGACLTPTGEPLPKVRESREGGREAERERSGECVRACVCVHVAYLFLFDLL